MSNLKMIEWGMGFRIEVDFESLSFYGVLQSELCDWNDTTTPLIYIS